MDENQNFPEAPCGQPENRAPEKSGEDFSPSQDPSYSYGNPWAPPAHSGTGYDFPGNPEDYNPPPAGFSPGYAKPESSGGYNPPPVSPNPGYAPRENPGYNPPPAPGPAYGPGPNIPAGFQQGYAPPGYPAPYYQQSPYGMPPIMPARQPGDGFAVASLVLGIISVVCCYTLVPSILAIIFGAVARSRGTIRSGMATAGLVLGIIALVIGVLYIIAALAFDSASSEYLFNEVFSDTVYY